MSPDHDEKRAEFLAVLAEIEELKENRLAARIEELKENRLAARKDARSGNPAKRAQGERAVEGITDLIRQRRQLISKEDES